MPHPCLLEVTSLSEGTLKGSGTLYGKSGVIIVYGVDHSVGLTVERFDGFEPMDRLTHGPLTVFKEVDAVSPVLYQHLNACTLLDKVVLRYYTVDSGGKDVNFYSVILSNAIVTRIAAMTKPVFLSKNAPYRPMEKVSFSYKSIQWVDEINAKETSYTTYFLHNYGDEKKLLTQGSLSAPIAPIGAFVLNRSGAGAAAQVSSIKTGVFDAKTGKSIVFKSQKPTISNLNQMRHDGVETTTLKNTSISPSDEIDQKFEELRMQGHGPQRHEGGVSIIQLENRCTKGYDPMTGKTIDGVTGDTHKYSANATKVNSPEDYVKSEEFIRNSDEFIKKIKSADIIGQKQIVVKGSKLKEIFGDIYSSKIDGRTRIGSAKNPLGSVITQFNDNSKMVGVYRKAGDGTWKLVTMYPDV
jgi:type VI secretion system Hcp family effector